MYPYRERKTHIGSYPIDTVSRTYGSENLYLKKAELCHEEKIFTKPALFKRFAAALANFSEAKDGNKTATSVVESIKESCSSRKLQYDRYEKGIGGTDSKAGGSYTLLNMNIYLSPTVSTMILNKNKSGEDLFDSLTRIGGLFAFFFLVLRPFANRLNSKLYMGSLVKELFIFKRPENPKEELQTKEVAQNNLEFERSFKESNFYNDLPMIENSFITVKNNPSNTLPGVNGQANPSDNAMDGGANEMQELQRIQNSLANKSPTAAKQQMPAPSLPTNFDNPKFHLVQPGCCSLHDQSK